MQTEPQTCNGKETRIPASSLELHPAYDAFLEQFAIKNAKIFCILLTKSYLYSEFNSL